MTPTPQPTPHSPPPERPPECFKIPLGTIVPVGLVTLRCILCGRREVRHSANITSWAVINADNATWFACPAEKPGLMARPAAKQRFLDRLTYAVHAHGAGIEPKHASEVQARKAGVN